MKQFLCILRPCTVRSTRLVHAAGLGALLLYWVSPMRAADMTPNAAAALSAQARFDQKLGSQVPLDLVFRDETGQPTALRNFLGQRPAVLVLGYHECPMLCSLVLGGLVSSMTELRHTTRQDFDLIDVSINPADSVDAAAKQKRIYFKRYARHGADAGWHFLTTANEANIQRLADAVGFRYAYDPASKQYAHPSGIIVLTPEGKVSHYLFGVTFDAGELQTALRDAGQQRIGSPVQELLLRCFHYNPITGKYGAAILSGLRIFGVLSLLLIAGGITYLVRRTPSLP